MGCLTNNLEIYPPRKAEKEKTVAQWVVSCVRITSLLGTLAGGEFMVNFRRRGWVPAHPSVK